MSALLEKEQDLSISGGQWLVGVYFLCAHGNDRIRGWARRQVRQMGMVEQRNRFSELEPILDKLINEAQACAVRTFESGSREDASMSLTQGKALSVEEKEIWTGILAVQRQLHASVVRDLFLPRYPEFLPLVVTCVVDGGNALFPAAQYRTSHLLVCGRGNHIRKAAALLLAQWFVSDANIDARRSQLLAAVLIRRTVLPAASRRARLLKLPPDPRAKGPSPLPS
eukprot:193532-Rhodomonas_salina.2